MHRFVPTLTEVVQPPPAMHVPEPLPITPEVLERIREPLFTTKSERLRREIRSTVRESVQASLAQAIPELRHVPTSGAGIRSAAPHVSGTT